MSKHADSIALLESDGPLIKMGWQKTAFAIHKMKVHEYDID